MIDLDLVRNGEAMMDPKQFEQLIRTIDSAKWTEIFSTVVIGVSLLIAVISILYARMQLIKDHQRSQRKIAVDMCLKWTEFNAPETSSVMRLIERLTPQQAETVAQLTRLEITSDHRHDVLNILQLRFSDIENVIKANEPIQLEGRYLQYIRHIAVRYLNMLESILLAWAEGIADHDVIVDEFSYILDEPQNRTGMEEFRRKVGFDAFPSIALFIDALRDKRAAGRTTVKRPALIRKS